MQLHWAVYGWDSKERPLPGRQCHGPAPQKMHRFQGVQNNFVSSLRLGNKLTVGDPRKTVFITVHTQSLALRTLLWVRWKNFPSFCLFSAESWTKSWMRTTFPSIPRRGREADAARQLRGSGGRGTSPPVPGPSVPLHSPDLTSFVPFPATAFRSRPELPLAFFPRCGNLRRAAQRAGSQRARRMRPSRPLGRLTSRRLPPCARARCKPTPRT